MRAKKNRQRQAALLLEISFVRGYPSLVNRRLWNPTPRLLNRLSWSAPLLRLRRNIQVGRTVARWPLPLKRGKNMERNADYEKQHCHTLLSQSNGEHLQCRWGNIYAAIHADAVRAEMYIRMRLLTYMYTFALIDFYLRQ